jgi:hypothetical protein
MKNLLFSLSLVTIGMTSMSTSCEKEKKACDNAICTEVFMTVATQVVDNEGKPVVLDEVYTMRTNLGDRINIDQHMGEGHYIVLDDNYQPKLQNNSGEFTFVGKKDGKIVVEEPFTITADCCHIEKKSGKDVITLQ